MKMLNYISNISAMDITVSFVNDLNNKFKILTYLPTGKFVKKKVSFVIDCRRCVSGFVTLSQIFHIVLSQYRLTKRLKN